MSIVDIPLCRSNIATDENDSRKEKEMPAMQPGSGGPYSDQKYLRFQVRELKNILANKPMGPRTRKGVEDELEDVQVRLKNVNAKIREMSRPLN